MAEIRNPFAQGLSDVTDDPASVYGQNTGQLRDLSGDGGPNLQGTLDALRTTIQEKYREIDGLGGTGIRITQNLVLIRSRVNALSVVINTLFRRLADLERTLQTSFDATLQNIAQDIGAIRQGGMNQIVGEIVSINNALSQLRDAAAAQDPQLEAAPDGPLEPTRFNAVPVINAGPPPNVEGQSAPANPADNPAGFVGGGKNKKGGYTYPKMRSRSRLRSHPRITHKFKTIKPKKKTRHQRKHKKSSKKHRKH